MGNDFSFSGKPDRVGALLPSVPRISKAGILKCITKVNLLNWGMGPSAGMAGGSYPIRNNPGKTNWYC
jgi:hypothetical protein